MPYYDYKCTECDREIEIQHSIKEDARENERHIKRDGNGEPCDGKLTRLISANTGFTFEGGAPTPKTYS